MKLNMYDSIVLFHVLLAIIVGSLVYFGYIPGKVC